MAVQKLASSLDASEQRGDGDERRDGMLDGEPHGEKPEEAAGDCGRQETAGRAERRGNVTAIDA